MLRDRHNVNISKRIKTLLRKSNSLASDAGADVYVLVRRKGKVWEYNFGQCTCWPLSKMELVSLQYINHSVQRTKIPRIIYSPLPIRKTTKDFEPEIQTKQTPSVVVAEDPPQDAVARQQ